MYLACIRTGIIFISKQADKEKEKDKEAKSSPSSGDKNSASSKETGDGSSPSANDPPATPTGMLPPSTPSADIKSPGLTAGVTVKEENKEDNKAAAFSVPGDDKKDEVKTVSQGEF